MTYDKVNLESMEAPEGYRFLNIGEKTEEGDLYCVKGGKCNLLSFYKQCRVFGSTVIKSSYLRIRQII